MKMSFEPSPENARTHWLLQPRQKRLFGIAAAAATLCAIFGLALNFYHYDERVLPPLVRILGGLIIGTVMVPLVLLLYVGMGWYWLKVDTSPRKRKVIWFLILLFGNWIGAIPYYYYVYRNEDHHGDPTLQQVRASDQLPVTRDID